MALKETSAWTRQPMLCSDAPDHTHRTYRDDGLEGRLAPRKAVVGQGVVRIPGYRMSLPCRLVNISATGACLRFLDVNACHLPDRIVVVFTADRTEIDATIQWRARHECGVHFVSLFRKLNVNRNSN